MYSLLRRFTPIASIRTVSYSTISEDPRASDAEFPGRNPIATQVFTVARFHLRIVQELFLYRVEDRHALARAKPAELALGGAYEFDPILHGRILLAFFTQAQRVLSGAEFTGRVDCDPAYRI